MAMTNKLRLLYTERAVLGIEPEDIRISAALIGIEQGVIVSIEEGTRGALQKKTSWSDVEDLGDQLVTPAFINSHTHLSMVGFRGIGGLASKAGNVVEDLYFRLETHLEEGDVRAFSRIGALESLMSGTAFCWDHYYFATAVANGFKDVGLCGAVGPTLQDLGGPGVKFLDKAWEDTFLLDEDSQYRNSGIVSVIAPHATDTVSDDLWKRVAECALVCKLPIHTHLAQSIEEVERSVERYGCTPLTRMQNLGICDLHSSKLWVHGLFLSQQEIDRLNPSYDYLGHCPGSQMQFAFPAPLNLWRQNNLKIVIGTDAASCNDSVNPQAELRFMSAADSYSVTKSTAVEVFQKTGSMEDARKIQEHRQLDFNAKIKYTSPQKLLYSLWGAPYKLHPKAPVGVIAVGAWANLCCWDTDHPSLWPATDLLQTLAYNNITQGLLRIMVRGNWQFDGEGLLSHRIHQSFRVEEWLKEATARIHLLRERAGLS
ncbi:MAG: hypothetical protein CMK59_10505 [Proteobacteria bacterium]|nr:hypothetical protein [Pseudomonadota bacterium]